MIALASAQATTVPADGIIIAIIACFLLVSFVFSGTETAFFSLQSIETQRLEDDGKQGARVLKLLNKRTNLITTILLGNETANIALTAFVAFVIAEKFQNLPTWANVVLVTPVIVLFTEITPKILAYRIPQV